jgi:ABC-type nitrate/sulfonate/bicarbonate transport system permease component
MSRGRGPKGGSLLEGANVDYFLGTLNAADMMVALVVLGLIAFVMAVGIRQIEVRLLRWRPEHQKR